MTEKSLQEQFDQVLRQNEIRAKEIADMQSIISRLCAVIGLQTPASISNVGRITIPEAAHRYNKSESCIRRWMENKKKKITFVKIKGIIWLDVDTLPPRAADLQANRPLTKA